MYMGENMRQWTDSSIVLRIHNLINFKISRIFANFKAESYELSDIGLQHNLSTVLLLVHIIALEVNITVTAGNDVVYNVSFHEADLQSELTRNA